jgi:uncharacterized membrane protein
MAVFDPYQRLKATVKTNNLGAVAGAVSGVMLLRRYTPLRGWVGIVVGVFGGAIGGAYAQQNIKGYMGSKKSANSIKK